MAAPSNRTEDQSDEATSERAAMARFNSSDRLTVGRSHTRSAAPREAEVVTLADAVRAVRPGNARTNERDAHVLELATALVGGGTDSKPLTRREKQVLALVESGAGTLNVARRLGISPSAVKTHLDEIYVKAGFPRAAEPEGMPQSSAVDLIPFKLTPTQAQVLELILAGATNPVIAGSLVLPAEEVSAHLHDIYRRFSASDRYQVMTELASRRR